MHVNAKRQAIRQALSLAASESRIKVVETVETKGTVKPLVDFLNKIEATGKVLLVVSQKDELVERATRNLQNVKAVHASYLNVYDLLNADTIVVSQKSLDIINEWLGKTAKAAPAKEEK